MSLSLLGAGGKSVAYTSVRFPSYTYQTAPTDILGYSDWFGPENAASSNGVFAQSDEITVPTGYNPIIGSFSFADIPAAATIKLVEFIVRWESNSPQVSAGISVVQIDDVSGEILQYLGYDESDDPIPAVLHNVIITDVLEPNANRWDFLRNNADARVGFFPYFWGGNDGIGVYTDSISMRVGYIP